MTASCGRRLLAAITLFVVGTATGQDSAVARLNAPTSTPTDFHRPISSVGIYPRNSQHKAVPLPGLALSTQIIPASGIIFSGHVISVWRAPASAGTNAASTVISFQVDEGIRGTSTGQLLVIREWAGLGDRGERYRTGESLFLFLYPLSKLGLTSPVAGTLGRFALDAQRRIVIDPQNASAFAGDPVIGGKTTVPYADFERAVLRSAGGR